MSTVGIKRYRSEGNEEVTTKRGKKSIQKQSPSVGWNDLPKDLLHHILGFFFSRDSHVDETSIISVMRVSKHWNEVATSTALWQIPQRGSFHPVRNAFGINASAEFYCSAPIDENRFFRPSSFLGFVKLESSRCALAKNDNMSVFRALERSTRQSFLLCVSPRNLRSKEILNHIFEKTFVCDRTGGDPQVDTDSSCPLYVMGSNCQRIVLVYHDRPLVQGQSETPWLDGQPIRQSLPAPHPCCHNNVPLHLLAMRNTPTDRISTGDWAIIVDWIFEVATCFNLGLPVVFSGMELFRRFVDGYWEETHALPPKTRYQCLASATLLIAAKCHLQDEIRPVDLARCADRAFTVEQLLFFEGAILSTLEWNLNTPTLLDFVNIFRLNENLHLSPEEDIILQYLSSLALQSQVLKIMNISRVAVAILMMTRFWLQVEGQALWMEEFEQNSGCSFEESCNDVVTLSLHLEEIRQWYPHLKVITRYHSRRSSTGDLTVPLITSTAPLVAYRTRAM